MSTEHVESEVERRARYAAKDVTDKLGLKAGMAVRMIGKTDRDLARKVRAKVGRPFVTVQTQADVVLYWPQTWEEITPTLRQLKTRIAPNGGIWVISYKKDMGEPYLPDTLLIPLGLAAELVDNKICSVSETQSAMRFVIRRSDR
ncbi:MAG: hypothetical protein ABI874_12625 [Chloroflexota bacterium]